MKQIQEKAFIFGAIFTLANRLQILGDKLDENITVKQWLLLATISKSEHPAPSLSEVAKTIGNSRQNVKKMALILENQGFLSLTKDDIDTRITRITLNPKCITYFQNRNLDELNFLNQLFDSFDEDMITGLYQGLNHLAENIINMENTTNTNKKD